MSATASTHAAIVWSGLVDIVVPANADGIYLNMQTGQYANAPGNTVPGWDVNIYGQGANLFLWGGNENRYMTLGGGGWYASNLPNGSLIGAASEWFSGQPQFESAIDTIAPWKLNSDNFMGIRFLNQQGATRYAWMRVTVGANPGIRTIREWVYEDDGGALTSGWIPAPGGLPVLAMLVLGKRSRKRCRARPALFSAAKC